MATNPIIQELINLIEAPENGRSASPTSEFANTSRTKGTVPHGGLDINRGHAVGGTVSSPVHGIIGSGGGGKYNTIIIHEVDPVTKQLTGFDIEILHAKSRFFNPGQPVVPGQKVGLEGGVGAGGVSHAHVQVFNRANPTPLNPLLHLYQYHHPGQAVPSLPELSPYSVPPIHPPRRDPANDPIFQNPGQSPLGKGSSVPDTLVPGGNAPAGAPLQLHPGSPVPGAEGSSSVGGPNGPTPLVLAKPAPQPSPGGGGPAPTGRGLYYDKPTPIPNGFPYVLPGAGQSPPPPSDISVDAQIGNEGLDGTTASSGQTPTLQAWAAGKMGATVPPLSVPSPGAAPQPPVAPASAIPPQPAPIFAPQPAVAPAAPPPAFAQIPAMQALPIFAPPRKPIDLSVLGTMLVNRAPIFPGQG
jgi:hypothetical protein